MGTRRPKEFYKHKNGFTDPIPVPSTPLSDKQKEVQAVEARGIAQFFIEEMGSYFPSREKRKQIAETTETLATVKTWIALLNKEHKEEIAKLCAFHAETIKDDAMDRYLQTDPSKYLQDNLPEDSGWRGYYVRLEELYRNSSRVEATQFNNVIEQYRYEHLQMMLRLYKRRAELENAEELVRIIRAAQFPLSLLEFRSKDSREAQLRVARFLMADETKREAMRTESHWAWRQTQPLIDEYVKNDEFRAEIQRMVQETESHDPRSRRK